jgi:hypothetical protein
MPEPYYRMAGQPKKIAAERCVYIFGPLCTRKVEVVTEYEVLSRHLPGRNEEKDGKS